MTLNPEKGRLALVGRQGGPQRFQQQHCNVLLIGLAAFHGTVLWSNIERKSEGKIQKVSRYEPSRLWVAGYSCSHAPQRAKIVLPCQTIASTRDTAIASERRFAQAEVSHAGRIDHDIFIYLQWTIYRLPLTCCHEVMCRIRIIQI